jgi:LacI family transcriptional regulator
VVVMLSPVPLRAMPPFVMYWVDELREHLAAAGGALELHVSRTLYVPKPARALESVVRRFSAAAWLLYLSTGEMQRWFQDRGLPCLVAGSCASATQLPSGDVDYRAVCRHAAGQLLARGGRHPALVLPQGDYAGDRDSEAGFREAWERSSVVSGEPLIVRHDGTTSGLCAQLNAALKPSVGADGFIVARSGHALTALTHLLRRGVRVPEDVAVISRDDDAFLDFVVPRVARYASDPAQFASRLSRAAIALVQQGMASSRAVRLMPRYVAGETV